MGLGSFLAMLAFEAAADRQYDNSYDYWQEQLEEERERQQEEELRAYYARFPLETYCQKFVMRCRFYIPYYNETVECRISHGYMEIDHFTYIDGVKNYDCADCCDAWNAEYDCRLYQDELYDHTYDINPERKIVMGYIISAILAMKEDNMDLRDKYEAEANKILEKTGHYYCWGLGDITPPKGSEKKFLNFYDYISEGVKLFEGRR